MPMFPRSSRGTRCGCGRSCRTSSATRSSSRNGEKSCSTSPRRATRPIKRACTSSSGTPGSAFRRRNSARSSTRFRRSIRPRRAASAAPDWGWPSRRGSSRSWADACGWRARSAGEADFTSRHSSGKRNKGPPQRPFPRRSSGSGCSSSTTTRPTSSFCARCSQAGRWSRPRSLRLRVRSTSCGGPTRPGGPIRSC